MSGDMASPGGASSGIPDGTWRDVLLTSRGLLRPYRATFAVALVAMAGHAVTTGLYAYLVGPLLAFLFTGGRDGTQAFFSLIPGTDPAQLDRGVVTLVLPAVIMAVAALKGLAYFGQMVSMGRVGQGVARDLRLAAFRRLMAAPVQRLQALPRGDVAARIGPDVDAVHQGLVDGATAVVRDGLTLIVLMALAVWLDWMLALLAFVVLPLALVPIVRFGRRLRHTTRAGQEAHGALSSLLVEALANRAVLRTEAARRSEEARVSEQIEDIGRARLRAIATKAVSHPVMEFLGVGGLAATLWFAAFRIWSGALAPAAFVSFFAAVLMLYEPLKSLSRAAASFHEALAGFDRVRPILELPAAPDGVRDVPPLRHAITLDEVDVLLDGRAVLRGASLVLRASSTTVVRGASGAGKTTLLRVLAGLLPADAGAVRWDGTPFDQLRSASLAARVGYLDQEARCFGRTFRDNLSMGSTYADDALWRSLEAAGAAGFVRERGGLDAAVSEGAGDLSGGQRRRLALARVLLDEPSVLLLDEPTGAVDVEAERHILATLRGLAGTRVVVVVAHRPESVDWADQQVRVTDGGVLELVDLAASEVACV